MTRMGRFSGASKQRGPLAAASPRLFLDERGQPAPGRRRRTLATQVLRPRPAQRQGEKVEYIHLNPVRAGLVSRPEDWSRPAGSSYNEYAGMSAGESVSRRTV